MTPATLLTDLDALSGRMDADEACSWQITTEERKADMAGVIHAHWDVKVSARAMDIDPKEHWKPTVLFWIATNPGRDAVDVARQFGLDLRLAVDIVGELSEAGLLRDA